MMKNREELIKEIESWGLECITNNEQCLSFKRGELIGLYIMFDQKWKVINTIFPPFYTQWKELPNRENELDKFIDDLTLMKNWAKDIKKKMKQIEKKYELKEME